MEPAARDDLQEGGAKVLVAGARLGRYEIVAPLGAGGMGEVWRARDARLGREVAIKVLPRRLTADPAALQRFEREARAVAALSHPNILAIHDFERDGETLFAVTELLEGESFRERLRAGPASPRRVREWGAQVARALAAAHDRGLVHRDVKPENLFLTTGGAVKLLDFGVARQQGGAQAETAVAGQGSLTTAGMLVGTVGYIAPEQLRGEAVEGRADLFALGCVLYELLTGERAFAAGSAAEVMSAILEHDPPRLETLAETASPELARIVRRCLEKQPERRFQSAHDLAFALEESAAIQSGAVTARARREMTSAPPRPGARRWLRAAVATAAALLLLLAGIIVGRRLAQAPLPAAVQGTLELTPEPLSFRPLALAPDGRAVAFSALDGNEQRLWVRSLITGDVSVIAGTDGAAYAFWSPDSRHLGFFAGGKLKRVPAAGGPVLVVAPATDGRGGSWNAAGTIVFAPASQSGLQRVPAAGGTPQDLTRRATRTGTHRLPRFLPDGKHLLFVVANDPGERNGLYHLALDTGESHLLVRDAGEGYFAHGHLLFHRDGSLLAQPFDPVRGELSGAAVVVAPGVFYDRLRKYVGATVSDRLLIYRPSRGWDNVLTWFDEQGRESSKVGEPGTWTDFELSLDGTQAAVFRDGAQGSELWVVDLREGTFRRLANGIADDNSLAWSPSGDELLVTREPVPGQFQLIALSIRDGSERILDKSPIPLNPTGGWTPDGRTIVYGRGGDLWAVAADGKGPGRPLMVTPQTENLPRLSPDGRWVAYLSNETGRFELYASPFPSLAGRRQLSNTGTGTADWAEGGRALLYYEAATRKIRRIAIGERGGQPHFGAPTLAFEHLDLRNLRGVDFEPQGRRLLGGRLVREGRPPLHLVVDWRSLLERAP